MPRQRCTKSPRGGVPPRPPHGSLALLVGGLCLLLMSSWALSCNMLDRQGMQLPGSLGTGGGGQACTEPNDCPGLFTECQHPICSNGICGAHYEAAGTACSENEGVVCDGAGECVECIDETQCSGGYLCDQNLCVPASCLDDTLSGDETDLDCGGSCAPCADGKFCNEADDCQSGYCASNGVCAPCSAHEDCDVGSQYCCLDGYQNCDLNVCVDKEDNGSECDDPVECASGYCPVQDRVCCDGACDGQCYGCIAGKTGGNPGECLPVEADTDPEGECGQQPEATCQSDGRGCDGAGACLLWPQGTVCDPQHCSGGDTQNYDDTCDGNGSCDDSGIDNCSPYICEGNTCRASCTGDGHCLNGSWCDVPNCVSSGNLGDPCGGDNECQSGHCEDGRCCESACAGECMACASAKTGQSNGMCRSVLQDTDPDSECSNGACYRIDTMNGECRLYTGYSCGSSSDCLNDTCRDNYCCNSDCAGDCRSCNGAQTVGSNGICSDVVAGTDPDNECDDQGAASCGYSGECAGGACEFYPAGTECGAASCSSGTMYHEDTCNGGGSCLAGGSDSCFPYFCKGDVCALTCTDSSDCDPSYYCNGSNNCIPF